MMPTAESNGGGSTLDDQLFGMNSTDLNYKYVRLGSNPSHP